MPDYLLTATSPSGKRKTQCIQAASAQEAMHELETDEYQDIVLHTDDFTAALSELMPQKVSTKGPITPADHVALRNISNWGIFLMMLKKQYQRMLLIIVCWGIFTILLRFVSKSGSDGLMRDLMMVSAALIVAPFVFAILTIVFMPARKLKRVLEATYWGRWDEVLKHLPPLQNKMPQVEFAVRKAVALSGLGKLDEALTVMEPFSDPSKTPHWMYLSRLADVYEAGGQLDHSLVCRAQAYEADTGNSTLQLSYANALLRMDRDLERAGQLLENIELLPLSDQQEVILPLFKGLLELNRGNYRMAVNQCTEAINRLKPYVANQPYSRLHADNARAYTAIALAELGEREEAERLYQSALPRLEALNSTQIMELYQQAVLGNKT
ncbi:MAG: hypothetical protein ACIAZJ_25250 [Gimesia chilikensis]|uniref:hypothetical protein n=1 Tax=Gimesia chilikensis TaxID=2605989 RepID=UPI003796D2EB